MEVGNMKRTIATEDKHNPWRRAKMLMADGKHGEALAMLKAKGIPEDEADFYVKHNGRTSKSELEKEYLKIREAAQ
jgi:hypothetical protein